MWSRGACAGCPSNSGCLTITAAAPTPTLRPILEASKTLPGRLCAPAARRSGEVTCLTVSPSHNSLALVNVVPQIPRSVLKIYFLRRA